MNSSLSFTKLPAEIIDYILTMMDLSSLVSLYYTSKSIRQKTNLCKYIIKFSFPIRDMFSDEEEYRYTMTALSQGLDDYVGSIGGSRIGRLYIFHNYDDMRWDISPSDKSYEIGSFELPVIHVCKGRDSRFVTGFNYLHFLIRKIFSDKISYVDYKNIDIFDDKKIRYIKYTDRYCISKSRISRHLENTNLVLMMVPLGRFYFSRWEDIKIPRLTDDRLSRENRIGIYPFIRKIVVFKFKRPDKLIILSKSDHSLYIETLIFKLILEYHRNTYNIDDLPLPKGFKQATDQYLSTF